MAIKIHDPNKKAIPRIKGEPGAKRERVNWPLMFEMWCDTDLTIIEFLRQFNGLNPYAGNAKNATKEWTNSARLAFKERQRIKTGSQMDTPAQGLGLWDTIKGWRREQGSKDYNAAEGVRTHLKMILNQTVQRGEDGVAKSLLKANELKAISETLVNIQRIERLALGMSTENVGMEIEIDSNVEKKGDDVVECPTFIVEMSEGGKFKRPRPRQVG